MRIGAILLAAGGSTRLGSPKQFLRFGGRSLLQRAARTILETGCRPVAVVLGAHAGEMRAELAGQDVRTIENTHWERGMGSSVRLGLETVLALAGDDVPEGVLLTLCDQPLVDAPRLRRLLDASCQPGSGKPLMLAAASYSGTVGVPAVFGRAYFAELLALGDETGARQVLLAHRADLTEVIMPEAAVDIDTREQYERLTDHDEIPSPHEIHFPLR